ncbi:ORF997 [White spot syndrome virus]|uniref:ORF997 n=1 Tax=White spot syndrome virus TaxID=342409 RepID=A0A2D3I6Y2_9VIRU|nr:ORF997 [White spot syndrome virus]
MRPRWRFPRWHLFLSVDLLLSVRIPWWRICLRHYFPLFQVHLPSLFSLLFSYPISCSITECFGL